MSELTIQTLSLQSAGLGAPGPLPPIPRRRPPAASTFDSVLPSSMPQQTARGHVAALLPFSVQQANTRRVSQQAHPVAVLENELQRAVFLLNLGGRSWPHVHTPSQIGLLANSPSLVFCNLALQNTWFRGGLERL